MDQHRLECFIALAEELHFHRAAERCHISQPTMSQQLKLLEAELNVGLVHRSKRRVSLTPAGVVFLEEATSIIRHMRLSASLAQRTQRGEIGQLRIGATGSALYIVVPEILKRFREFLPDVGVILREMNTADQERALRDGSIEVGVVHPPLDDISLSCEVIAEPPFTIALPSGHRLAAQRELQLKDLASEQFIMFPRKTGPKLYDSIIALCQEAGFSPAIVIEAHPAQSIIAMTAAEIGVGFIATDVQQHHRDGVVYRPLVGSPPRLSIGVAYLADTPSLPVRSFREAAIRAGRLLTRA